MKLVIDLIKSGSKFHLFSEEQRLNKEICLAAIRKNYKNIKYVLNNDREIIEEAIKINAKSLKYVNKELLNDVNLIMKAIKTYPNIIKICSNKIKLNKEIILAAINSKNKFNTTILENNFVNDRDVILALANNNRKILFEIDEELKNDNKFVEKIISYGGEYLFNFNFNDKELVILALKYDTKIFLNLNKKLKNDIDICKTALKYYSGGDFQLPSKLYYDKEYAEEMITKNKDLIEFFDYNFFNDKNFTKRLLGEEIDKEWLKKIGNENIQDKLLDIYDINYENLNY